jgi:DUF971 family protein
MGDGMSRSVTPVGLKKIGDAKFEITWEDGHVSVYPAPYLREQCPCAGCVDEWTGEKRIISGSISPGLTIKAVDIVGQYALNFTWSDGHNTGIYSFQTLRALCPCALCRG